LALLHIHLIPHFENDILFHPTNNPSFSRSHSYVRADRCVRPSPHSHLRPFLYSHFRPFLYSHFRPFLYSHFRPFLYSHLRYYHRFPIANFFYPPNLPSQNTTRYSNNQNLSILSTVDGNPQSIIYN